MTKTSRRVSTVVVVYGLLAGTAAAFAADRTADEILKELDAVVLPRLDPAQSNNREAIEKFLEERKQAAERRGALILELYKAAPEHERLVQLLPERWLAVPPVGPRADEVSKEIDEVIAHAKNEKLKVEAAYARVAVAYYRDLANTEGMIPAVEQFLKIAPQDPRGPSLLYLAVRGIKDEARKAALEDRIVKEYPNSPVVAQIKAARRLRDAVGKPFELEFTDAITNTTVSMKNLKGKVVVVDFWATWCGPCIAEMPKMKELYAKYKDQGVEFIGVSLDLPEDKGGLKKLKDYVEKNEIGWPQYYQGNYWQSAFSSSWGIDSIPRVFIVDAEGNLYSTEARGRLEELIPELLKKAKAPDAGGGK